MGGMMTDHDINKVLAFAEAVVKIKEGENG
jgi:hypothetical protein